ncbi:14254_t:CDS:1, partial [Dentiscutata erythropus]
MFNFISEIPEEYSILAAFVSEYMSVNPMDKPKLPLDYKDIEEIKIVIPLTSRKQIAETARRLRT